MKGPGSEQMSPLPLTRHGAVEEWRVSVNQRGICQNLERRNSSYSHYLDIYRSLVLSRYLVLVSPALSCHLGVQSSLFAAHLRRNIRYTAYSRVLLLPGGYIVELFNTTPVIISAAKHRPDQPPGSAARDSETSPPLTTRIMTSGHRTQDSEASSGLLSFSHPSTIMVTLTIH